MKKMTLIFTMLISTANFAMMQDVKYQNMFIYNVEAPFRLGRGMVYRLLQFKQFVAVEQSLRELDENSSNISVITKAIADIYSAQFLMTNKINELKASKKSEPEKSEERALFKAVYGGLTRISENLIKRRAKILASAAQ